MPTRITIDSKGNIWVVDVMNMRVQQFDNQGHFIKWIGCGGIQQGEFMLPVDAAIDSGDNLWVLDEYGRVQEFDSKGAYLRQFGSRGTAKGQFYNPTAIAIDHSDNIWIADVGRVQEFNSSGAYLKSLGVGLNKGPCLPSNGCNIDHVLRADSITIDSGDNLWLMESGNVRKLSSSGAYQVFHLPFGSAPGSFNSPKGIAIDGNGNFWVTDTNVKTSRVEVFSSSWNYLFQFGSQGTGNGQLQGPHAIAIH
jgi:DNA-binding beta-propeller fold protein YncE